jgi:site-specific recombinase XerD
MPVLQADDRIPKIGKPSDVALLLAGCAGEEPEDLRDRALVWLLYSSGIRAADAVELTIPAIDFETGVVFIEDGTGDKDRQAFISPIAAEHIRAYLDRGRTPLLKRMPKRHGPIPAGAASRSNLLATDVLFLSSRGRKGEIGLTPSGVLQILTRRYHAAGGTLSSFGPHRLRHGMATYMAEQGVDQREIQRWGPVVKFVTAGWWAHQIRSASSSRAAPVGPPCHRGPRRGWDHPG